MQKEHHVFVIEAVTDLVKYWEKNGIKPAGINLPDVANKIGDKILVGEMKKWVQKADDIIDVEVDQGLAKLIMDKISNATRFQHFAYCGSMGKTLREGETVIKRLGNRTTY